MKDNRLSDLNFDDLIQYGGMPDVKHKYEQPLPEAEYFSTKKIKNFMCLVQLLT
jgi:hypothetical protein